MSEAKETADAAPVHSACYPRFSQSSYNGFVPIEKTVSELYDKCEQLRGNDGTANVRIRLGLLRRLADYLDLEFEQVGGIDSFVRKRSR